jgi:hypothetical protein
MYAGGTVDEFLLSHVLEHISNPLHMMGELFLVAAPGARMVCRCPYGSSDDAWEDPTHVREIYMGTFRTFEQPYYWRVSSDRGDCWANTYDYYGDWKCERITLHLSGLFPAVSDTNAALRIVQTQRNMVNEIVAELVAVKPIRAPKRELQEQPEIVLVRG